MKPEGALWHATCIAFGPQNGILILGPSGSGKSALGLQLMALGAQLVSDDQTVLTVQDGAVFATAPLTISGLIEARGVGILQVGALKTARLALVVDLGTVETARLPHRRQQEIHAIALPLLHKVEGGHFPAAILHYMQAAIRDGR